MKDIIEHDGEQLSCVLLNPSEDAATTTAVLLHGAGTSEKERLTALMEEFAARGCRALAFDFSGHGGSSGELGELSLRRRFEQAVAVIAERVPTGDALVLVGFSMSGQTVADLTAHYGPRVTAIGLCAPAVYAAEAWPVRFGAGFTEIIRRPGSWRDSGALESFRAYGGRAVLVVPGTDAVIPQAVTEAVAEALGTRSRFTRLDVEGADHQVGMWLRDNADDRGRFVDALLGEDESGWAQTRAWVEKQLPDGEHIRDAHHLSGGITAQMRRLSIQGPDGERDLVLRSFVEPFFRRHAPGLLTREADILTLLAGTDIPTPTLQAVDATGEHCDDPSLLMSLLPGTVRLDDEDLDRRIGLLARQLVRIHAVDPPEASRPRTYQAWTSAERVRIPADTSRPDLWRRAVDVIGRTPPPYEGRFLHRDFHPGNVLFSGSGDSLRVSGVVDWVETSWGPADLDVAHCSTVLALLYGVPTGMLFADRYTAEGGHLTTEPAHHLYWRLLDALVLAPDAEKVAVPWWRAQGRTDLTPDVLTGRLEDYVAALFERY
ncbi:MAG: hypothetical protein QOF84_674 [Streptomyces sp.]|nr:hypothetical protein [Streptomyces sp.]